MTATARAIAENASFQTFANCYLKEIDPGRWVVSGAAPLWGDTNPPWADRNCWLLELDLPGQALILRMEVLYRSVVGRHRLGKVLCQRPGDISWQPMDPFAVVQVLVGEIYRSDQVTCPELRKTRELELLCRISESYQVMGRYLEARLGDPNLDRDRFIDSEQSLLCGHWAHPTPKSRQGMVDWAHDHYAPELRGQFRLHLFAVDPALIQQRSACDRSAAALIRESLGLDGAADGFVLVPVHPLQATWLLQCPKVVAAMEAGQIRNLGPQGPAFTATSSVRTVYNPVLAWMFKLSIPVRITNSRRVNKHSELEAGTTMARLLERTRFGLAHPRFRTLDDPAYLTVRLPGLQESGFEVILRDNPFTQGHDRGIQSVAALTQEPLPRHPSRLQMLIEGLALTEGRHLAPVSRDWFSQYWDCAIEPAIRLFDAHGIALEAHQQNSLLDVSAGYPRCYYYRDNQGFYLSPSYRSHLLSLDPRVGQVPDLFYEDGMIRDRFTYYLIFNQLFAVIYRFGADRLIEEATLVDLVRSRLQALRRALSGAGRELVAQILNSPRLAYKGNLLTRVQDVDELQATLELAVYTQVTNPLALKACRSSREVDYEVA